jgi:hypothetical protein
MRPYAPAASRARPIDGKLASPRQRVRSAVGLFGLVADDMGERMFGELAREMGFVAGPISE